MSPFIVRGDALEPSQPACATPDDDLSQTRLLSASESHVLLTDESEIASVISLLSISRAMGTVSFDVDEDCQCSYDPTHAELAPGPRLLIAYGFANSRNEGIWQIELQGPYSLVRFRLGPEERLSQGRFRFPTSIECIYRRSERRVQAPPGALLRIQRHGDHGTCERPLRDIGMKGLQFVLEPSDQFVVGEQFLAEVSWKHGRTVSLRAEVRHVYRSGPPDLCGVLIAPCSSDDTVLWTQEVCGLMYPETMDAKFVAPEQIWDLYDASGYFGLDGRHGSDFAHLRKTFSETSQKLANAPQLSCRIVRQYCGQVQAAISLLRCWSTAWIGYQAARRPMHGPLLLSGNAVLRDMFVHAYESIRHLQNLRWHVSYIRKDARFSKLACFDFATSRLGTPHIAVVPFRAMRMSCATQPGFSNSRATVGLAQPNELQSILDAYARHFPEPYLDAYDLVAERFTLAAFASEWQQAGLLRRRVALVARHGTTPCAAAVLDMVEPGIHLVGLLDAVHVIALNADGRRCFPALLTRVQEEFASHGRSEFVLFEETGEPAYALALGAIDMGEADQVFISAALTSEFLDHISRITAPRFTNLDSI
jgi:hypothetical protein